MGRDRNIHETYPMFPEKHEVYGYADWIPILKAVYKKKKQGPNTPIAMGYAPVENISYNGRPSTD